MTAVEATKREQALFSTLERIGRIRLSENFFLRDFLYSETAIAKSIANVPDDLDLALTAGIQLCEQLLEPISRRFGRIHIRSAYRSAEVNGSGNAQRWNCSSNEANYADHMWDRRDRHGNMGATACIVGPKVADILHQPGAWTEFAWWIHDNLPYSSLTFFKTLMACNVQWRENPERRIESWTGHYEDGDWITRRLLTKPGMANHEGNHSHTYERLLTAFPA
jgi:hypothetical protein